MADAKVQSYDGVMSIDLTPMQGFIVDLKPGWMVGKRRHQPGLEGVEGELAKNSGKLEEIGVALAVYTRFVENKAKLVEVRAAKETLAKMLEVVTETEAWLEDSREADIATIANAAKQTAKRVDGSVAALFEKTVKYHGEIATRAAKTRRKNEEAAASAAEAAEDQEPPTLPR